MPTHKSSDYKLSAVKYYLFMWTQIIRYIGRYIKIKIYTL